MADVAPTASLSPKTRCQKRSTRIDMTPMVDLAFLLLTFFVLTAALTKPYVLRLEMPEDRPQDERQPINANRVLTLILDRQDRIFWFPGREPNARISGFSRGGIRKVLLDEKRRIKKMYVLIKLTPQAHYRNLVDILDEVALTGIEHYAIVDLTPDDLAILKAAKTSTK